MKLALTAAVALAAVALGSGAASAQYPVLVPHRGHAHVVPSYGPPAFSGYGASYYSPGLSVGFGYSSPGYSYGGGGFYSPSPAFGGYGYGSGYGGYSNHHQSYHNQGYHYQGHHQSYGHGHH